MAQQSKIELLLELKDRISTGITKAKETVSRSTDEMKRKVSSFKESTIRNFQQIKEAVPGLSSAISMLKNPFVAVTGLITGIGVAVNRFVGYMHRAQEASNTQAIAEQRLSHVMQTTMNASAQQVQHIKDLASAQQRLGIIGDEIQLSGAQELSTYLTKESSLKKLLPVMNDMLAQQYGLNATQESAVNIASMMGKVMDGQVGALSRYGYKFTEAQEKILKYGTEAQRAATLAEVVSSAVGGMNEALANTPEGQMKQLSNDMGDLDERLGAVFTNAQGAFMPFYQMVYSLKERLVSFIETHREEINAFIGGVASVVKGVVSGVVSTVKVLGNVISFLWSWREVILGVAAAFLFLNAKIIITNISTGVLAVTEGLLTAAQWLLNVAMNANPIGIIITAIGLLIGIIVALCRRFTGWATVWNAVKTTLVNSFKQYVATWKFGFQEIWFEIQIIWKRLQSFGQFAAQLFQNIGKAIKAALSGNFKEAKDILKSKITTEASKDIEKLKAERDKNRKQYANDTIQRVKDTKKAWQDVQLTKKVDEKKSSTPATNTNTAGVFSPSEDTGEETNKNYSPNGSSSMGDVTQSVTGSASQIRNITINIDSFIKGGINTQNTEMQHMSGSEIASYLEEQLMRIIRNIETSY